MSFDNVLSALSAIAVQIGFWNWPLLWMIGVAGAAWGCWGVYQVFLDPPHRKRLHSLGVSDRGIIGLKVITVAAAFEAVWGLVSGLVGLPLIWDLAVLAAVVVMTWCVWQLLRQRDTFKPLKVAALALQPLGLSIAGLMPLTAKVVDQAPVVIRSVAKTPVGDAVAAVTSKAARLVDDATGIVSSTIIGRLRFTNSTVMGGLGDQAVARIITAKELKKLPSKFQSNKGIDGVFVKYDGDDLAEVWVVENKVNGSRLAGDQMTRRWIERKCEEMEKYGDSAVKETARVIRKALSSNGEVVVSRQLVQVDFETGRVTSSVLDDNASALSTMWSGDYSNTIQKVLADAVISGKCTAIGDVVLDAVGP
jgi:hypothetical protein